MHPILFTIPGLDLPIFSYGVMLGLSLVVGWTLIMHLGKRDDLPTEKLGACFIWTAVAAMVGARVLFILTNLDQYRGASLIDLVNPRTGGLVAYGGFLGGFLGSWIYLRTQRLRLLPWADLVVPTLGTGLGITRIGCLLYGCDYGRPIPEDAPGFLKSLGLSFPNWQIAFPELAQKFEAGIGMMKGVFEGSPAYAHHLGIGLVEAGHAHSALVYPTQILSSLNGWLAFALVMLVRRKKRFHGEAFLAFTAYYGVTRSLIEILRGDVGRGSVGALSTSQAVGIATFVAAGIAWIVMRKSAARDLNSAMALSFESPRNKSNKNRKRRR